MNQKEFESYSLVEFLSVVEDPRVERMKLHSLSNILFIVTSATICGANGWREIVCFAEVNLEWLSKYINMDNGVPSEATIARVLGLIDPNKFEASFYNWANDISQLTDFKLLAIDGKSLNGTGNRKKQKYPIHVVSVWCSINNCVISQKTINGKPNEYKATLELLDTLFLQNTITTLDALSCHKEVAEKITQKDGDYILQVKKNEPKLYDDCVKLFENEINSLSNYEYTEIAQSPKKGKNTHENKKTSKINIIKLTKDDLSFLAISEAKKTSSLIEGNKINFIDEKAKGHGRKEIRRYWLSSDVPEALKAKWPRLSTIGAVERIRFSNNKISKEIGYYISSIKNNLDLFKLSVRKHWGIENKLHYVLDVGFKEDSNLIYAKNAAKNLGMIRRIAVRAIKQEKSFNGGAALKRSRAGWDLNYRDKLMKGT